MPQIQQLPAHIADLIAAGEVVERPASVCKELLENALDAGASAVSVELEKGGMTYLRVTDNGCGIAPEQLPTAFLRHATSKLHRAEDLAAIGTLGFRGEALAAISAVSRVDIFSRQRETDSGASLHLEGGVPGDVKAAGCPEGTTICVRELFYNTPARMKFMKKDSAEGAAATSVVTQLALSHPDVSFKLLRDGQEGCIPPATASCSAPYTPRWGATSPEVCCPWTAPAAMSASPASSPAPPPVTAHGDGSCSSSTGGWSRASCLPPPWRRPTATGC